MAKPTRLRRAKSFMGWHSGRFAGIRAQVRLGHSGQARDIKRFGRTFLTEFPETTLRGKKRTKFKIGVSTSCIDSPVAIALTVENTKLSKREREKGTKLAEAALGFEEHAVTVWIQGEPGAQAYLDRFKAMHGSPWANYLLQQIEAHAKRTGFREVKIPVPESQKSYKTPMSGMGPLPPLQAAEARASMRSLYEKVADAMHYRREGDFFVKKL